MTPVAFLRSRAAPQVVRTSVLQSKTLLWRNSLLPKRICSGAPMKPRFMGTGDIIEAFTMEEIPQEGGPDGPVAVPKISTLPYGGRLKF